MKNSFENLFKAAAKTMPKAKSPKRNAAHYAAQAASVRAQRNAIAKSLAAIARHSPQKAVALNASILARVKRIEKALSPSPRRVQNRRGRVTGMYIPAPPSLKKLENEAIARFNARKLLIQEALKKK
jgi:hypothetical protein